MPDTTPDDIENRKSNGEPNAKTRSPCCTGSIRVSRLIAGCRRPGSTLSTAMSVDGSAPMTSASWIRPSLSCASMRSTSSITWLLVTM